VFPLRGKPLNVRSASLKQINECEEIQCILKIMGLKIGTAYEDASSLRYGHIMIMSDQDHDGSHIKGLIVNLVHHFWPQLLRLPGFLTHFITPIVKALPTQKGTHAARAFFSLPDFVTWRSSLTPTEARRYTFKYYKGLGTSTAPEGREYFSAINDHRIKFVRETEEDERRIILAFGKDKVEDRKQWITNYEATSFAPFDYRNKQMTYRDFIDKELILFSVADCERSIPNVIDGLKPGQRKILFACFKRNLVKPLKVAQLAGYVSEHSAYHHGEASLTATIVNLAQDYVGANNVPLLVPDGQYGTRLQGGKDSASARYIFTNLAPVTRFIYPKADDFIVDYKDDDGFPVEPHFYVPVIPMVLVNGTSGIGTGFATNIPNFSPWDIIANIRRMIRGEEPTTMVPWYYGFTGDITPQGDNNPGKFFSRGKLTVHDSGLITVSELPIGYWTGQYKKFLEELTEKDLVVSFRENHTDVTVDFDIVLHPQVLQQWTAAGKLEEKLDLRNALHTTNLIGFNDREALTKYATAEAVMKEFFVVRLDFYGKRKAYLVKEFNHAIERLMNMVRFVTEVIEGKLDVTKKKKPILLAELKAKGFKAFPPQQKKNLSKGATEDAHAAQAEVNEEDPLEGLGQVQRQDTAGDSAEVESAARDYDYLLGLRIWSLTFEMVERLQAQLAAARAELAKLLAKEPKALWIEDLDKLEGALQTYFKAREKEFAETMRKRKPKTGIDMKRVRMPTVLSDSARALLNKEAEKEKAKAPKDPNAPKPKRAAKKKKAGSDDDAWDLDGTGDEDDDDDDHPLARTLVKRPAKPAVKAAGTAATAATPAPAAAAPKPKRTIRKEKGSDDDTPGKPKPKRAARKKKSSDTETDSDEFDFDDDDSESEVEKPPRKQSRAENPKAKPAKKEAPAAPTAKAPSPPKPTSKFASIMDDDDDDVLLLGVANPTAAPAAKSKPPAKPAAPKKAAEATKTKAPGKRRRARSESSESESESGSSDGGKVSSSEESDWSDSSDD
jgi:DNA topoisomerase-2